MSGDLSFEEFKKLRAKCLERTCRAEDAVFDLIFSQENIRPRLKRYQTESRKLEKKAPDFDRTIRLADDIVLSESLVGLLLSFGPQVSYVLAKNKSQLARINRLDWREMYLEVLNIRESL